MKDQWLRRSVLRAGAVLTVAGMIASCASVGPQFVATQTFDPRGAAFIHATGRAKVSGQAFVRLNSGKLLRAVGTDVLLVPRTPYADERFGAIYRGGKGTVRGVPMPDADPLYEQYVRRTIASSGGSFSFDRVADGDYYIVAMIHLPSKYSLYEFPIMERVNVEAGRSVRVVMRGY